MISRFTSSVAKEDVLIPRVLYNDWRCSQTCRQRSEASCQRTQQHPVAPNVFFNTLRCSQTYQNHSKSTSVPVIRDLSYSERQPEYPCMVWYSPDIDPSKFTLHILSDTPGGSQWLECILLRTDITASLFVDVHQSKPKLTFSLDYDCFIIVSPVSQYSLWQMLLTVLADWSTSSLLNASYDCRNSGFDIVFQGIWAKTNPDKR